MALRGHDMDRDASADARQGVSPRRAAPISSDQVGPQADAPRRSSAWDDVMKYAAPLEEGETSPRPRVTPRPIQPEPAGAGNRPRSHIVRPEGVSEYRARRAAAQDPVGGGAHPTPSRPVSLPAEHRPAATELKKTPVGRPNIASTSPSKGEPKKRVATGVTLGSVLLALIIVAAIMMAVRGNTVKLTAVSVYGTTDRTDDEIIAMAGLRIGMPMEEVSLDTIAANFSVNTEIGLDEAAFDGEQGVRLTVSRRTPKAALASAGVVLIIDEDGVIMERVSTLPEGGLVLIRGMDVTIGSSGKRVESTKSWQMEAMLQILTELEQRDMIASIQEMNLMDRFGVYLTTRSGMQIIIGEVRDISTKVVWAMTVIEKLNEEGITRGVVDVSTGKNAIYAER